MLGTPALVCHEVAVICQARAALLVDLLTGGRKLAVRRQSNGTLAHCIKEKKQDGVVTQL